MSVHSTPSQMSGLDPEESTDAIIARLTRAQQLSNGESIQPPEHISLLRGRTNWLAWRNKVCAYLSLFLDGRLCLLMHDHPATSAESYCIIFGSNKSGGTVSIKEAIRHRQMDIHTIGRVLAATLSDTVSERFTRHIGAKYIDGLALWDALRLRYGSLDVGAGLAAFSALVKYTFSGGDVVQAIHDLELLFAQLEVSGMEPYADEMKVMILLHVFQGTTFDVIRSSILLNWNVGRKYTYERASSAFISEFRIQECVRAAAAQNTVTAPAVAVLPSAPARPSQLSNPASPRHSGAKDRVRKPRCYHCHIIGHRWQECWKRQAGQPPSPVGKFGKALSYPSPSRPPAPRDIDHDIAALMAQLQQFQAQLQ